MAAKLSEECSSPTKLSLENVGGGYNPAGTAPHKTYILLHPLYSCFLTGFQCVRRGARRVPTCIRHLLRVWHRRIIDVLAEPGIGEACPDVTSGLWLIAVTSLSLLLLWFWRRKLPEQVSLSQTLGGWAQSRAGSQSKQLCVPSCVLPLRPTTPLSLRRCLIWSERGFGQRKVPPVDFYYLFFLSFPLGLIRRTPWTVLAICNASVSVWCCDSTAKRVWDGAAASVYVREFFFQRGSCKSQCARDCTPPLGIINSNILPKRSSFPKTLRGKYIINHAILLEWLDLLFLGTLI